mgnify:CR=1 FL=1
MWVGQIKVIIVIMILRLNRVKTVHSLIMNIVVWHQHQRQHHPKYVIITYKNVLIYIKISVKVAIKYCNLIKLIHTTTVFGRRKMGVRVRCRNPNVKHQHLHQYHTGMYGPHCRNWQCEAGPLPNGMIDNGQDPRNNWAKCGINKIK